MRSLGRCVLHLDISAELLGINYSPKRTLSQLVCYVNGVFLNNMFFTYDVTRTFKN